MTQNKAPVFHGVPSGRHTVQFEAELHLSKSTEVSSAVALPMIAVNGTAVAFAADNIVPVTPVAQVVTCQL